VALQHAPHTTGEMRMFLGYLVGLIIVFISLATVVVVFYVILREPHKHEEHYIPPETDQPIEPTAVTEPR
jgi:uncharacterized membrane protein